MVEIPVELFLGFIGFSFFLAVFGFLRNPQIPATIVFGGIFILTITSITSNITFNSIPLSIITDYEFTSIYDIPFGTTQYRLNGTYTIIGERFITNPSPRLGEAFDIVNINMARVGTLSGNYTIGVFNGQGNTIRTFCTFDSSILLTSFVDTSCHLTTPYVITQNDRIGIRFTGGSAGNYIAVRADTTNLDPYAVMERFGTAWANVDPSINHDMRMKIVYNKPINTSIEEYEFTELPKTLFILLGAILMLCGGLMVYKE